MRRLISSRETEGRHPTLRIVGAIFTGLGTMLLLAGGLLLTFGLYLVLMGMTTDTPKGGSPILARPMSLASLSQGLGGALTVLWSLGFLMSGLQFLAMGGLLRLALHVEENTRRSARCLEDLRSRTEPSEEVDGPFFVS